MSIRHLSRIWLFIWVLTLGSSSIASARESMRLESGWRFVQGEATGAEQPDFEDKNWQEVSLPHNWGWETAQEGKHYYRGPGWYRRELDPGPPKPNRRYFLRFEAASSVADIYLNGQWLGQHRGAFGAFCFEITRELSASGTNLLAVRVSNAPEPDLAPLSGDFSVFGGLYRPACLIETAQECFALTDHGSPGVAWLQTSVSRTQAVLDVTAQISNATKREQPRLLVASVLDAEGRRVAGSETRIKLMPGVTAPFTVRVVMPNPRLWNGRQDPHLYRAVIELCSAEGVMDSIEQPLGLRWFSVDPEKGFFLNGQPYHLHGVNLHQDRQDKGWAVSEADLDEDLRLVREMGCTVLRCAHYQHSDYLYSLCDRAGLLVWAELPQVNEAGTSARFAETSRSQLLDLIRQNINHPSIFAWSLFNELWPKRPDPHRLLQDLQIVAKGEDPTRPTIAATATSSLPQMNQIPDLLGWNVYCGWYAQWGPAEKFGAALDERRNDSRFGGISVSEYGAGANVAQHEQDPQPPKTTGQWHPEEWQALVHEAVWPAIKSRPYVWGSFIWVMFDFTSNGRNEGGLPGRNDKGLATADRKIRKDAFYYYKANWSDEPVLHIASRRFTERTNAVTEVKVYSNARDVELSLNGISQGVRANGTNDVFVWGNIRLSPGVNRIQARARHKGADLEDRCEWNLRASGVAAQVP